MGWLCNFAADAGACSHKVIIIIVICSLLVLSPLFSRWILLPCFYKGSLRLNGKPEVTLQGVECRGLQTLACWTSSSLVNRKWTTRPEF